MKLSVFTTITDPIARGDNPVPALQCYSALADELVVVDGGSEAIIVAKDPPSTFCEIVPINNIWAKEFSWEFIGQQFTRGYEACTGDVVIHADLDFIFHEKSFETIREAAQQMLDMGLPAMSFYKYQFTMPDRYNLKSRLVVMVNKRDFGDRIKFNSGGDLCQPSIDGKELRPDDVPQAKVPIYNYEKLLKTEAQVKDDVTRMARAWHRHFGDHKLGYDDTAYDEWLHMALGRLGKPHEYIKLEDHPKYVQETIRNLRPDQWGYSGFGNVGVNRYA